VYVDLYTYIINKHIVMHFISSSKFLSVGAIGTLLSLSSANAVISFMDIAVIGVRDTATDGYAVVALDDWNAGDSFFISDAEVDGTTINDEDAWLVTINNTITAGTVVILDESMTSNVLGSPNVGGDISTTPVSSSSVYRDTGTNSVSFTGTDGLIVFSSTDNAATEANSTNLFYIASTPGDNGTPRGLTEGSGRNDRAGNDYYYTGTLTGTATDLFAAISEDANWTSVATAPDFANTVLNSGEGSGWGGGFTVVPEPSSSLLSIIGLGSLCFLRRRS